MGHRHLPAWRITDLIKRQAGGGRGVENAGTCLGSEALTVSGLPKTRYGGCASHAYAAHKYTFTLG